MAPKAREITSTSPGQVALPGDRFDRILSFLKGLKGIEAPRVDLFATLKE
jgi:hypothetical protein